MPMYALGFFPNSRDMTPAPNTIVCLFCFLTKSFIQSFVLNSFFHLFLETHGLSGFSHDLLLNTCRLKFGIHCSKLQEWISNPTGFHCGNPLTLQIHESKTLSIFRAPYIQSCFLGATSCRCREHTRYLLTKWIYEYLKTSCHSSFSFDRNMKNF